MDFDAINILREVPVLDDGVPLTEATKMYVNNEVQFRQIPLSRFLSWLKGQLTQFIYPVGAVYITMNEEDPADRFGGTWEKISGKFLLGSQDGTYSVGSDGGSATHTLTVAEMPIHNHTMIPGDGAHTHSGSVSSAGGHSHTPSVANFNFSVSKDFKNANDDVERVQVALQASGRRAITAQDSNSLGQTRSTSTDGAHTHSISISSSGSHNHTITFTGGGLPHNNMPPYYVVNIWRRVS